MNLPPPYNPVVSSGLSRWFCSTSPQACPAQESKIDKVIEFLKAPSQLTDKDLAAKVGRWAACHVDGLSLTCRLQ